MNIFLNARQRKTSDFIKLEFPLFRQVKYKYEAFFLFDNSTSLYYLIFYISKEI